MSIFGFKKVKVIRIVKFLLIFVVQIAWIFSGWPQIFNFPPEVQEVQAAVSITQTANPAGVAASSTIATYSSVSIGTAASDRIVAVVVGSELNSSTASEVTIDSGGGAVTMTAGTGGSFGALQARIFYLLVSTGTTATITVKFSSVSPGDTANHIAVYRVVGANTLLAVEGADGTTDAQDDLLTTGSTTIPTNGGMLAVAAFAADTTARTWSQLAEDIDADAGGFRFTTAISTTAGTATRTCSGANNEDGALSYVIFNPSVAPTVTTQAVSGIDVNTATGNGNVTLDGGDTVTERGVVANTTGTPTTANLKFQAAAGGTGVFTASMTGLDASTHYYVRAYAINAIGTSYGGEVEFNTNSANSSPTLTVNQPDGTNDTVVEGASYNIDYNLADSDDVVTVAFYYDADSTGLNGTAISGPCATAAEGTGATCAWNTTSVAAGSYYVYGITNDGTNPAVNDYSSGTITIDAQSLTFSLSANAVNLGTLSTGAASTGSHTFTVETNASNGMVVSVFGSTLASGTDTITAMSSATTSSPGSKQFGINLKDNASPNVGTECSGSAPIAAAATGYNTADNFKFVSGETIASSSGSINSTTCTISYIANISAVTNAGSYATTLTYIASGTF